MIITAPTARLDWLGDLFEDQQAVRLVVTVVIPSRATFAEAKEKARVDGAIIDALGLK